VAEAEFAPLVRDVAGDGVDTAERFARAAWSSIAEPGDGDAGVLVSALGAVAALEVVLTHVGAAEIVARVAEQGLESEPVRWAEAQKRWAPRADLSATLRALRQGGRYGMRLLAPGDDVWPEQLDDLQRHAPFALWARGDVEHLGALDRSVALVGARAATGYGEHVTVEAASGLVDRGFAIVSGAAYGVDGMAHRAALASQGVTVAVLAGGLDRFYPSGHEQLLDRIVQRGVALAEVPPGTTPTKWRFLQRNRLIAALACATVVVEAGWRSGSLNTAKHAATLGRPLGAVPGPVTSAASAGCHRLLREFDAVCVTTADEMAELAGLAPGAAPGAADAGERSATQIRLLDALNARTPRRVDHIAELSGLGTDRVRAELGLLELDGVVVERPSGWLRPDPKTRGA
jgi:DNA processing protein